MGLAPKPFVTPAKAGVQTPRQFRPDMDSGFRRNDETAEGHF
jgi:hypothetical protein